MPATLPRPPRTRRPATLLAAALLLAALPAVGQEVGGRCASLRAQFDALDPDRADELHEAIQRQQDDLRRALEAADASGCFGQGIVGQEVDEADGPCPSLDATIRQGQRRLASLKRSYARMAGTSDGQHYDERNRLATLLERFGCNGEGDGSEQAALAGAGQDGAGIGLPDPNAPDHYRAASAEPYRPGTEPDGTDQPPSRGSDQTSETPFPDDGGKSLREDGRPPWPDAGVAPQGEANGPPLRTICVRACDGFFFPISAAVGPERYGLDEQVCRAQCPAAEVGLYVYDPATQTPDDAVSADTASPLKAMPNAFRYRTRYDETCSCRHPGQSWAEALGPAERMLAAAGVPGSSFRAGSHAALSRPPAGLPVPLSPGLDGLRPSLGAEDDALDPRKRHVRVVGPVFQPH